MTEYQHDEPFARFVLSIAEDGFHRIAFRAPKLLKQFNETGLGFGDVFFMIQEGNWTLRPHQSNGDCFQIEGFSLDGVLFTVVVTKSRGSLKFINLWAD